MSRWSNQERLPESGDQCAAPRGIGKNWIYRDRKVAEHSGLQEL